MLLILLACWVAYVPPAHLAAWTDCEGAYAGLDDWPTTGRPVVLVGTGLPPVRVERPEDEKYVCDRADGWRERRER